MTSPVRSHEPVFEVEGRVRGEVTRDLVRLEVEETTAGLKTLTARLSGPGAHPPLERVPEHWLDGSLVDFGERLEVSLGPSGEARTVFRGHVSALEAAFADGGAPQVVLFAEDRLMELRTTRRSRSYADSSDADVARRIAGDHGLAAEVDADGPTYDVLQQWSQSDLAFLRERAALIGAEAWVDGDTLCFKGRERRNGTEVTLVRGGQLLDVQIRADLAHQRTAVRVTGYDARARAAIDEEAGAGTVDAEVEGGLTGPALLRRAFGERASRRVRDVALTAAEGRAWARAEMLRRARAFVTVAGTTSGTPDLVVGSRVSLQRVGGPFNGPGYYVTRVQHSWDRQGGHRTRFEAERPTLNQGAA